jgi:NADP-dependent 3-hydroxy acid dehydrogenase YdfG
MASLKENIALITGASSGVGRAIALELAALGALVLLVARDPQKLKDVADAISAAGGKARTFAADLTDDKALAGLSAQVRKDFTRLDFLVHSAGVFKMGAIASAPLEDLDALMRCNVRAPFALTQSLLPLLISSRGSVAFINSTAGETTHANVGQYAASKFALKALADTLRLEVNAQGVRVLSVMLGRTATPMQEEVCRLEGSTYDATRFLQPRDVAQAVVNSLTLSPGAEVTNLFLRPARK